jgi:pimeloyl-ACP methyl ester carboxylesterase
MNNLPLSYPVIVLPGIMGSALRDEYPVEPETVWSPLKLAIKRYDRIIQHPDNTRYEVNEPARVVADQMFAVCYGELIEELRYNLTAQADEPVPVFPFAYDWRQRLDETQYRLADFIKEVIERTKLMSHYHNYGYGKKAFPAKVDLVAHSMGGLIVAGYMQAHGSEGLVNRIATIATPFEGSLEAPAKVAIGESTLNLFGGTFREREAARVTPALYHLLPDFRHAVRAEGGLSNDLFLPKSWQPGIIETLTEFVRLYGLKMGTENPPKERANRLLREMLNNAWKFRERARTPYLPNTKDWLVIAGVNAKTRVSMSISSENGAPRFNIGEEENGWGEPEPAKRIRTGDNTVPYMGAKPRFMDPSQIVCVIPEDFGFWELKDRFLKESGWHAFMPTMSLVQRLVISHLKGRPEGKIHGRRPPDLPQGKKWDPPIEALAEKA